MTMPSLPPQGSTSWYTWATGVQNAASAVTDGRLTDASLRAAFERWADAPSGGDDNTILLAAATDGLRLRPNSTYLVNGQLDLPSGALLVGSGNSTIIKKKNGATGHTLRAFFVGDVTIADLTIDGNRTGAPSSNHGISVQGCTGVTIQNVSVHDAQDSGIQINSSTSVRVAGGRLTGCLYGLLINGSTTEFRVNGVHIENSRANTSYEGGFYLTDASRGSVADVHVRGAAGHGFSIGGTATDLTFTGCVASTCGTPSASDHRGFSIGDTCNRVNFVGCIAQSNIEAGFYAVGSASMLTFTGCEAHGNNTAFRPGGHGFEVLSPASKMVNCIATGQLGDASGEGVGFFLASEVAASGCHAEANYSEGFIVYNAVRASLHGCTAKNNSQRGAGLHDGLRVFGDYPGAVTDLIVNGFHAYDTQPTKTQRYGVSIGANVDRYVITSSIVRAADHATSGLVDTGGTTKVVTNNLT